MHFKQGNHIMHARLWLLWGILVAGLAVVIGAFGAHGLKATLEANQRLETFETGARYQMYHGLALIGLALYRDRISLNDRLSFLAGNFFLTGTIIFSGSLYILSLTNVGWWGAVTPIGGVMQLLGWLAWGVEVAVRKPMPSDR
jgi:uncharacterized membrane protein YgdD (TMEM256/DUF423 family)